MSRYTYAGEFSNPTQNFIVVENPDGEGFIIGVKQDAKAVLSDLLNGVITMDEANVLNSRGWRPHTKGQMFEDDSDAHEWIEGTAEFFEQDYNDYLEENSFEICRMEQYEDFRNEY